jgi:hypothetical protein
MLDHKRDKIKTAAVEMKFTRQMVKYAWIDHERNEDILKESKAEYK